MYAIFVFEYTATSIRWRFTHKELLYDSTIYDTFKFLPNIEGLPA